MSRVYGLSPGSKGKQIWKRSRRGTSRAARSALLLESEGRGASPLPLFSMRAKWVKPYLSPCGFSLHCAHHTPLISITAAPYSYYLDSLYAQGADDNASSGCQAASHPPSKVRVPHQFRDTEFWRPLHWRAATANKTIQAEVRSQKIYTWEP